MRIPRSMLAAVALAAAIVTAGIPGSRPPSSSNLPAQPWRTFVAATTEHVVDGDTVAVDLDGRVARVRK